MKAYLTKLSALIIIAFLGTSMILRLADDNSLFKLVFMVVSIYIWVNILIVMGGDILEQD